MLNIVGLLIRRTTAIRPAHHGFRLKTKERQPE